MKFYLKKINTEFLSSKTMFFLNICFCFQNIRLLSFLKFCQNIYFVDCTHYRNGYLTYCHDWKIKLKNNNFEKHFSLKNINVLFSIFSVELKFMLFISLFGWYLYLLFGIYYIPFLFIFVYLVIVEEWKMKTKKIKKKSK